VLRVAPKQRTAEDAVFHKRINGAALTNAGAQSPASLSSRPVRYLWCDEIDRWPATTPEGDPLSLAKQRTAAYRRRKLVLTSTPTIKGASRIEDWYARSDMRVYELRCPHCAAYWRRGSMCGGTGSTARQSAWRIQIRCMDAWRAAAGNPARRRPHSRVPHVGRGVALGTPAGAGR
jgi:phage terminase large subunit GpA-like protein